MAGNLYAAFSLVCDDFGFKTLNEYQRNAQTIVIEKKQDVFVNLPTGFGKSVVFQALPLFIRVWKKYCNRRFSPR